MIKNITADQWKKQSTTTIQFVIKQLSRKIQDEGYIILLFLYEIFQIFFLF